MFFYGHLFKLNIFGIYEFVCQLNATENQYNHIECVK